MQNLLHRMSENIISFWVMKEQPKVDKCYPDYPVSPFGSIRMISKETIADLMK